MRKIILLIVTAFASCYVHADPVVDVKKVAGKTDSEVAAYLGSPQACSASKYGTKCQYKKGQTEIVFIKGKADWITVEGLDSVPFSKSALGALGLEDEYPSFSNGFTLRWKNIQGLKQVSIFKGQANTDYAYIKTRTE